MYLFSMLAIGFGLLFSIFSFFAYADTFVSDSSGVTIIEGAPPTPSATASVDSKTPETIGEGSTLVDHQAIVYHIEGDAKILKSSAQDWMPLEKGTRIAVGDQVRTGANTIVEIHYDEFYLNSVRLEANTIAEFKSIEPTDIYLTDGSIYSNLEGLPEGTSYQIATPTAVASVRGTQFFKEYMASTQEEKTCVLEGKVEVAAMDQTGNVNWNQAMEVKSDETLEWDRKDFLEKGLQAFQPKPMQAPLKERVKAMRQECHSRMAQFAGGHERMEQARNRWKQMKAEPQHMQPIMNRLHENQKNKFPQQDREKQVDKPRFEGKQPQTPRQEMKEDRRAEGFKPKQERREEFKDRNRRRNS